MSSTNAVIHRILNIVSVACALLVLWQFVSWFRERNPAANSAANSVNIGSKIVLRDVNWTASPRTVVLALSSNCRHCLANAPFYRSLVNASRNGRFRVVAVLGETPEEYGPRLPALGLEAIGEVHQADLESIGVRVTPTVLIVDDKGRVSSVWAGKLSESQQKEVYAKLESPSATQATPRMAIRPDPASVQLISAEQLRQVIGQPETVLIDSRPRDHFEEAHIPGALAMPTDEILSRAPHELPLEQVVYVYCHIRVPTTCGKKASGAKPEMSLCNITSTVLGWAGIHKTRFIADDLETLAAQGIPVTGTPPNESRQERCSEL